MQDFEYLFEKKGLLLRYYQRLGESARTNNYVWEIHSQACYEIIELTWPC